MKNIILLAIALLVVAVIVAVVLAKVLNKDSRNKANNKNSTTLKFDYYSDASLIHSISFIYSKDKLKDVVITMYFDSKETAKNAYKIFI